VGVGNVEIASGVQAAAVRSSQTGGGSGTTVAIVTGVAAGNRGNEAGASVDAAHGIVLAVHHNNVVLEITTHGLGRAPGGRQRRAARPL